MSMIKYVKLPFGFDSVKMKAEVDVLLKEQWKLHYNTKDYTGEWSALPLRAAGGDTANIIAHSNDAASFADTAFMQACPYITSVVNYFNCPKLSVRLLNLKAGAAILPHSDKDLYFEEGEARFHIPVITNNEVEFYLDEERIIMDEGACWYMNLSLKHSLLNKSNTDRIHLVIDCVVNDWVKDILNDTSIKIKKTFAGINKINDSTEQKILTIEALRQMNTATSNQMADELLKQLTV